MKAITARISRLFLRLLGQKSGSPLSLASSPNDEIRYQKNSAREDFWGRVLLAGLLIETVALFAFSKGKSCLELAIEAAAYFMVFGGVFGEIHFASKARSASDAMKRAAAKEVSESNERAIKAELETQRLKSEFAWRQITAEQETLLRHALSSLRGASVMIWHFIYDPETQNLAEDIAAIFRLSGWLTYVQPASFQGNFAFGMRIPFLDADNKEARETVARAFESASVDFEPLDIPSISMSTGGHGESLGSPRASIYVGPKPKPTDRA